MADTDSDQSEPEGEGLDESVPETSDPSSSSDDADVSSEDVDGQSTTDPEDKSDPDVWVDRDKIDFDPDDGLLSGTAIKGGTDIPGPHESVDDVAPDDQSAGDGDGSEESGDGDGSDKDKDGTDDEES